MRLTKQTGHAIRILVDCTRATGQLVKVAEIAKRLEITKQNVFKIVHILARAGFVAPVRGPAGGVRLAKPPQSIRVGDVVRAIEVTRVQIDDDGGDGTKPVAEGGALNAIFDDALTAFITVLDQHTLADLAQSPRFDNGNIDRKVSSTKARGSGAKPRKKSASGSRRG